MTFPKLALALLLLLSALDPARAQSPVDGIGVDQHIGQHIPLDLPVIDESGITLPLSALLHGRPLILTPVYYNCPRLCTATLNQLTGSLNVLSESAGQDFDILTLSIDPRETPALAADKKRIYLRAYRRPTAEAGWRFLTAPQPSVDAIAKAIGFRYRWDQPSQQFIHPGCIVVLSPSGKISQYFLGVEYPPTELRGAVTRARAETVGPSSEQVILYCFSYDPATGKYGLIISRALRIMGFITVLGLASLIAFLVRRTTPRLAEVSS